MTRIAYGFIRPGQDDIVQGFQRGLEALCGPCFPRASFENRISDDGVMIIFYHKRNLVISMTGGMMHLQLMITDFDDTVMGKPAVGIQIITVSVGTGMSH